MRSEPDFAEITGKCVEQYDAANYSKGMVGYVMRRGHEILDRTATYDTTSSIIEVGAGSGVHLSFVKRPFGRYVLTDGSDDMLTRARAKHAGRHNVEFQNENATSLSVADSSFDRLIATHVLEHLPEPHRVLREWSRVVQPGGTISLILPCDPGFAWRLGRQFGPRARSEIAGLPYDYFQAREHINPILNLTAFIDYYFDEVKCFWWPLRIPSSDMNLLYIAHIKVKK
jgi:phosphatidylethanolamine/phosphatidyl-N-methylethanolamine N-methyltransferase